MIGTHGWLKFRRLPPYKTKGTRSKGLVVVEMAIILPLMILLIFATIDFGRMFFTQITLQHAMREGGRFGVTGQQLPTPGQPQDLQSRIDSIKQVVHKAAVGVSVEPDNIIISSMNGGQDNAGQGGDTVTISMSYQFHFVTPIVGKFFNEGKKEFTVSTSFRNEPFPPTGAQ